MNLEAGAWTNNPTPMLSARVYDNDGQANIRFAVVRSSDGAQVWTKTLNGIPTGTVATTVVDPGPLQHGSTYRVSATAFDTVNTSATIWSGDFTIDQVAPAAPRVTSVTYPSDGTWHGAENQAGAFDLTLPTADSTMLGYEWGLDAPPTTRANANGNTTVTVTPPTNGVHVLQVRSIDRAGNRSGLVNYVFNVGRAGVVSPVEGAQVVRKVRLTAAGEPVFTHVQFLWRRGPDATDNHPISLPALTRPNGAPLTTAWTPVADVADYATWDASLTLGDVPGPVQVSARMATDANGTNAYQTAWVGLTVSPDAAYAATDSVGPGTVNLLTGDYTLAATDVDEFGLALGRTASSRDPHSGLELQPEVLSEATQAIAEVTQFTGTAVSVQKAANRWHRGNNSLLLTAAGTSADSYATVATPLPLRRGATYRVSGWVFVPAATGLVTDASSAAQRLNVRYQAVGGNVVTATSTRAVVAESWQQITMDVTIPSDAASNGVLRLYNGSGTAGAQVFYDDLSVREVWAPLGPQWSLGTADGSSGTAYSHISQPYPEVAALHLSGGGEIWFTEGADGKWWPEPGGEGVTLTRTGEGQWRLTELDGTVSTFAIGVTNILQPGQQLGSEQQVISTNGAYKFKMQSDGNLVLYKIELATGAHTPIWALNFQGVTPVPDSRAVMQTDGNFVVYSPSNTPVWDVRAYGGVYAGARLVVQNDGNVVIYRPDNLVTWNSQTHQGPHPTGDTIARLVSTSPPAASGQSRLVYENVNGRLRLARVIAPIQTGVDNWPTNTTACTGVTPVIGCQVQELVYATGTPGSTAGPSFGNYADRLIEVRLWSSVPGETVTTAVSAVRYSYDDRGMLREVWDPRISPALKTTYTYDGDGRVLTVTGAAELPWRFTYGTGGANSSIGNGDRIDRSSGRLLSVTRASLQPGSLTATGPDTTSTVVYNVPLDRAAGGPYDLNPAALATWAQTRGPTDATAIFGPENVPTVTTATSSAPGSNGYRPATVHYLDASGREVNTATPTGTDAPAAGFVDTAEYDRFGNVVRTLDATNRLLALGQMPSATADLAALNLTNADTATRSLALSSLSAYSPDGLDLVRTRGPLLRVAIGNNPADVRLAHAFTANVYDEGKPDGLAYHLLTTGTEGVVLPAADWRAGAQADLTSGGQLIDVEVTVNGYDPIDGASPIGPTSGWKIGSPTVVTGDAGAGGVNLVSRVRYNVQGRAVESRKVGSTGSDAGTVRSVFYTAGANPDRSECGNNAHYAGLPCVNYNAGPTTGSDTARMATGLPVRTVSAYNRYGSIATVTETATGPLAGTTVTQSRTTTTTYDEADRVTSVAITAAGAGVTPSALPKTTTTYDPASGDVTAVSTVDAGGIVLARTAKVFDALGRMTSYTDAAGGVTTTTFDRYGKPVTVADSTGASTTFTYDRTAEPRGYVTSVADSVGGTISATYGPDGQVLTQSLPGGVQLRIAYDAGRTPISRTYVRTSDQAVIAASAVVENGSGQFVTHTTPASAKTYAYDRLGRLTNVTDLTAGIASCTSRAYTYGDRAERLSRSVNRSANSTCPTATGTGSTSTSYSYDSGDRLVSDSATGAAGWVYDPLGRIVDAPVASNPGARVQNAYWVNDLIASQTIANVARQTWTLDPLQRFSEFTSETWMNNAWQQAVTKVNHYDSDSDSPAWISEDKSLPNEITRYVDGLDGSLAMQTGKAGARVLQLIDLQGSVMTTLPIADGASAATWAGIRHQTADEYGTPTDLTTGRARTSTGASPNKNNRYGWLGGAQRSTQALAGVTLMGVRLYDPNTGRFWSTDPVPGGNATTYDYCSGDPVNCTDLDGKWGWGWVKKAVKIAAKVGEIASNIPGPIGAAAAGVSAVAYAAQGNKSKAVEMGITAAAAMIPGGGAIVRAGARALRAAGSVSARAGRAAVQAVRCNSFTPETRVVLADGSLMPISSLTAGVEVRSVDPVSGETTIQPVLNVITGLGVKHLVTIFTELVNGAGGLRHEEYADRGPGRVSWTATANHPVWAEGRDWIDAVDLEPGDLTAAVDGHRQRVTAVIDHGYVVDQQVFNLTIANTHTFLVDPDGHSAVVVHNASCPVGGVYALTDRAGQVVRTGRTNNLARRQAEHAREFQGANFRILAVTQKRSEQRGLEQLAHNQFRPRLNRVEPISARVLRTTRGAGYMTAGRAYLQRHGQSRW
ncbi:RHS repeat-associated core domain-containing protein [Modestobacter sp. Leaf380]|uniref:RHS repeat-associated core domain-containing protein n=1 Tax=Modestobacter sp. Leaf380 TaxID=1736356 RepID=UPI000ADFCBCC|nr:RHS repeat-associated core domain-containing protein [Modestobacter sp. Leaf380]